MATTDGQNNNFVYLDQDMFILGCRASDGGRWALFFFKLISQYGGVVIGWGRRMGKLLFYGGFEVESGFGNRWKFKEQKSKNGQIKSGQVKCLILWPCFFNKIR